MKKKVIVLVSLFVVLILVSVISVMKVKSTLQSRAKKIETPNIKKEVASLEKAPSKKKSVFEEEQVVTEEIYPKMNLDLGTISEDVLPKGTVVSVKPVENNKEWVEIIADPKKGFIEVKYLDLGSLIFNISTNLSNTSSLISILGLVLL